MIKCVVFDLDNTLWDGIIAEEPDITLKPQMREILAALDERGILLSIASNSDPEQALAKLQEMDLLSYFLFPQCNDLPKNEKLSVILGKLSIGPDTVLFIDDDPFAIAEAKYFFPAMTVHHADEYLMLWDLSRVPDRPVSEESRRRREMILSQEKSREAFGEFKGTYREFLGTLNQVLTIGAATEADFTRVQELAGRTNRINNFGLATDPETIKTFFSNQDKSVYAGRLSDKFGDYGVIGACLSERMGPTAHFRLFCVSCRVESRGIAVIFLKSVIGLLQRDHPELSRIECRASVGDRNAKVMVVLKLLGFTRVRSEGNSHTYELRLPKTYRLPDYITVREKPAPDHFR